jgi:hypothetical protein
MILTLGLGVALNTDDTITCYEKHVVGGLQTKPTTIFVTRIFGIYVFDFFIEKWVYCRFRAAVFYSFLIKDK